MDLTTDFSETALDHAQHPRNLGALSRFNGHATITGPCGDTMAFWVYVEEGVIQAIGYTTDGCGSSHACGSMATELAKGMPVELARNLRQRQILDALGSFPEDSQHCALLASNTLRKACFQYLESNRSPGQGGRLINIMNRFLFQGGKSQPDNQETNAQQGDHE